VKPISLDLEYPRSIILRFSPGTALSPLDRLKEEV
jgi:hypothetical protein